MRLKISVLAASTAILLAVSPANAFVELIAAGPGSQVTGSYATPVVIARAGAPVTFLNQDVQPHAVASTAKGPADKAWCAFYAEGECPLLWAPTTDAGGRTTFLRGMESARAGQVYDLFCPILPNMTGRLVVV